MNPEQFKTRVMLAGREIPSRALETAIKHYVSQQMTDERHANGCIELAGTIAEMYADEKPAPKKSFVLHDSLNTILVAETIQPWVEKVRQELFGAPHIPFKSQRLAIDWLEKETALEAAVNPAAENMLNEISEKIQKVIQLMPVGMEVAFSRNWRTIEYPKGKKTSFVFCETAKLERLSYEIQEMEKAIRHPKIDLLMHVLTGVELRLPVARAKIMPLTSVYNLPTGGAIWRSETNLECFSPRELTITHLEEFLNQVRSAFHIRKKKRLAYKDRRLLELLKKHGHPPTKGNLRYWKKLTRQWNSALDGRQRLLPDALRKRYQRLRSRQGYGRDEQRISARNRNEKSRQQK